MKPVPPRGTRREHMNMAFLVLRLQEPIVCEKRIPAFWYLAGLVTTKANLK